MSDTQSPTRTGRRAAGFTEEEKAAMREATRERRASSRRSPEEERAAGEADVRAKIAAMPEPDRSTAERIHAIVTSTAPDLWPRTWYGSPSYYRDGNLICFFQERAKFKTRYVTLGFSDRAHLDDGAMWPNSYAVLELTPEVEARIADLVKRAVG